MAEERFLRPATPRLRCFASAQTGLMVNLTAIDFGPKLRCKYCHKSGLVMRASHLQTLLERLAIIDNDCLTVWHEWKATFEETRATWLTERMQRLEAKQDHVEYVQQLQNREEQKRRWLLEMQRKVKEEKYGNEPAAAVEETTRKSHNSRSKFIELLRRNDGNIFAAINDCASDRENVSNSLLFIAWTNKLRISVCVGRQSTQTLSTVIGVLRGYDKHLNLILSDVIETSKPIRRPLTVDIVDAAIAKAETEILEKTGINVNISSIEQEIDVTVSFSHHPQILSNMMASTVDCFVEIQREDEVIRCMPWLFIHGTSVVTVHISKHLR